MEGNRVSQSKSGPSRSDKANNVSGQESRISSQPQSFDSAAASASSPSQTSVSAKAKSIPNEKRSGRSGYNANSKNADRGGAVARAEVGSVSRPGSKKGNAVSDFVQFAYEKRRSYGNDGVVGSRSGGGGRYNTSRAENYSRHQNYPPRNRYQSANYGLSYNKEQYLQATCQFVVMEGFNYGAHLSDADLIVDWDHIEELRLLVDEIPSCPICLYPPVAAKITRCGHVFCWPCILHYLALSDKTWRKCPICYESVYKTQLKSVIVSQVARLNQGGEITMRLLRRDKGSNLILPATENTTPRRLKPISGDDGQFSKLLSISHGQVIDMIVARERAELAVKLVDDEFEPESCFIHEAMECLQEREKQLRSEITKSEKSSNCGSPPTANHASPFTRNAEDVVIFTDAFNDEKRSGGSCSVRSAQSAPAVVTTSARASTCASGDAFPGESEASIHGVETLAAAATAVANMNDKSYYFYQAEDGQQVYLHPVNARCFVHQYGSLASAPQTITGEIADIESFVMTEDLRRRFRYLAHLPLTSTFTLVELKLSGDVLSEDTVQHFAADFAKREEARIRKAKEEKRQQTQAERWERAVMMDPRNFSKFNSSNADPPEIPFLTYVPSAQRDIEAGFAENTDPLPAPASAPSDMAAPNPLPGDAAQAATPSFAQMLRQGKPKASPQPVNPPARQQEQRPLNGDLAELDEEQREFLHLHSFQDAFGDALQMALDSYKNTSTVTTEAATEEGTASIAGKRKKKKMKGRLLFATGAAAPGMH